jgi:hypothetical protein
MRFIIVITQFQIIVATYCQMLTHCMNVSYVICDEEVHSFCVSVLHMSYIIMMSKCALLFQCTACVL